MKIALVQINTLVGDLKGNAGKIIRGITRAKASRADLVCFHELALTGYPPRDLLEITSFVDSCECYNLEIASHAAGIVVVFGSIQKNHSPVGKQLFNVALWCEEGKIRSVCQKKLLPSYDVFDESRYFAPGITSEVVAYRGITFGLSVCEDIWFDWQAKEGRPYTNDPLVKLVEEGAGWIINLSASPYAMDKNRDRLEVIQGVAKKHRVGVIYVNQVGGNDELIFDGGSVVCNHQGQVLVQAPFFKEGMTIFDLDAAPCVQQSVTKHELLCQALVCGIRDYVNKCGFKRVVLGLSGGVDSSLVAYLAVKALGAKNVLGLIMPSRYSSEGSVRDAKRLAQNLGIKTKRAPIAEIHRVYEKSLRSLFGTKKPDMTEENIQARIRGNLLMAVSNKLGHLVLTTGNKSEFAVGYTTLYGDMSGGLAVISDLPKTLVYEFCHWINRKKEIIPVAVLTKPPSAELKPNQTDQDTLPPYEILDGIIKSYVEELKSEGQIIQSGFQPAMVRKVISMIKLNEYKRRQAPPGLKVTSKAFGMGRRHPIACKI